MKSNVKDHFLHDEETVESHDHVLNWNFDTTKLSCDKSVVFVLQNCDRKGVMSVGCVRGGFFQWCRPNWTSRSRSVRDRQRWSNPPCWAQEAPETREGKTGTRQGRWRPSSDAHPSQHLRVGWGSRPFHPLPSLWIAVEPTAGILREFNRFIAVVHLTHSVVWRA